MTYKEKFAEMKLLIPTIFIALKSSKTSIFAKIFATLTIMYALSPIDLIPDFIPVLGYLDDIIIIPLLVKLTISFIPEHLLEVYKEEAKEIWKDKYPKKWIYSIPILIIWIAILYWIISLVLDLFLMSSN